MGVNPHGVPYATQNPFERPGPAPDREGTEQTKQFTTIDDTEAEDAILRSLELSRTMREKVEHAYLPHEQQLEDLHVLAYETMERRVADFHRREKLKDKRIDDWQDYAMPVGEHATKYGRWVMPAMVGVEGPLAFVAGYSLIGGVTTGDALIDGPLKIAPLGFAFGIALVCCLATLFSGRLFAAYFEHRRAMELYEERIADANGTSSNIDDAEEEGDADE